MSKRAASACRERMEQMGVWVLTDAELLTILLGPTAGMNSTRDAAQRLLDTLPLSAIAWAAADELQQQPGIGPSRAAAIAAAFEWGPAGGVGTAEARGSACSTRRGSTSLTRPSLAHAERGGVPRRAARRPGPPSRQPGSAEGSLTQCPVSPRDALREPVRLGAHGVVSTTTTRAAGTRARVRRTPT